jgi:hypothetical protein
MNPELEFTAELVSATLGVLLSLALSFVPGLSTKWDAYTHKRELLAGVGVLVAAAMLGLHYLGALTLMDIGPFGWPVVWKFLTVALSFLGGGQYTYTATRKL